MRDGSIRLITYTVRGNETCLPNGSVRLLRGRVSLSLSGTKLNVHASLS